MSGCLIHSHNQQELLVVHIWSSDGPGPGKIPITQAPQHLLVPCGLIHTHALHWGSPEGGPWLGPPLPSTPSPVTWAESSACRALPSPSPSSCKGAA